MDTEVDVPNPTLTLVPGMYAEVNLRIEEHATRSRFRSTRWIGAERRRTCTRCRQPGSIHIVPVTLGLENDQRVEVLSGLQEGDLVVVGRHAGLKDGQGADAAVGGRGSLTCPDSPFGRLT